ncbi:MAG TPA: hypothetical protein VMM79_18225 [Longimicrobiales bacterium]|nr:hypothetical protein [Longimicrobiales bacterium]
MTMAELLTPTDYSTLPIDSPGGTDADLTDSARPVEVPDWFDDLVFRSAKLLQYRDDWDSYGGATIDRFIFFSAFHLLVKLAAANRNLGAPNVVPTSAGGVSFEWSTDAGITEIDVNDPREGSVYFLDRQAGTDEEVAFRHFEIPLRYLSRLYPSDGP